jgi:hypothetical protein
MLWYKLWLVVFNTCEFSDQYLDHQRRGLDEPAVQLQSDQYHI